MGFFSKIKNTLGIGGVKVDLHVPGQVDKTSGTIAGKVVLTTKSEQEIVDIKIKVMEKYTTGRGEEKVSREFELGKIHVPDRFSIKPGETKEVPFSVPFTMLKSENDKFAEKGGALGALGKMGKFANAEKSYFTVVADVDVKAAALDPSDKKAIKMV